MSSEEVKEKKEKKTKVEEKKEAPKKTNLGDTATIKRILDDAVIKVVLDSEDLGYVEDTALSNVKLIIGFASVGSSGLSHAYPASFPKNWWVLLACCTFYFVCSGILQFLLSFVELESILLVKGDSGSKGRGLNISSHFPRFQETYTLGIASLPKGSLFLPFAPTFRPNPNKAQVEEKGCAQRSWPVNKFFDEEGTFYDDIFEAEVYEFFKDYETNIQKKTK